MSYYPINIVSGLSDTIAVTPNPLLGVGVLDLSPSGVTAGSYTLMGGNVDTYGRLTSVTSATSLPAVSGVSSTGLSSDFFVDTDPGFFISLKKSLEILEGISTIPTSVSADYTVLQKDYTVGINGLSGAVAITLPPISSVHLGTNYRIKDEDGAALVHTITLHGALTDEIDGSNTLVFTAPYQCVQLYNNGTQWSVIQ